MLRLFELLYRHLSKQALRHILEGRLRQPNSPSRGRFLRSDSSSIYETTWQEMRSILPEAHLDRLPNLGNRHNVFLAVLSVSLYHALLDHGIEPEYARMLFADVGWKLYVKFLALPRALARIRFSNPQQQMNFVLRMLLRFPFQPGSRPGYEASAHETDDGAFATDFTYCPPFAFVGEYVQRHGDRGETAAFFQSWCQYDWALAYAIVEGTHRIGTYGRLQSLSQGDPICDMIWGTRPAEPQPAKAPY